MRGMMVGVVVEEGDNVEVAGTVPGLAVIAVSWTETMSVLVDTSSAGLQLGMTDPSRARRTKGFIIDMIAESHEAVAVGTDLTSRPPRRSRRAALSHRAPVLGHHVPTWRRIHFGLAFHT